MRIALALLLLAGCAGAPAGRNAGTETAPPPMPQAPPPRGPVSGASAWRAAISANEAPFLIPGNVTARLNEEVQIGDLRVTPLAVLEDSRCPVDVTCIWAGRVRLRVSVRGAGERVMEVGQPVNVPGGRLLSLVGVAPLNWVTPPPGVNPNAPKRFAFQLTGMD